MSNTNVISVYTLEQAKADGLLVELLSYEGKPVVATTHVRGDLDIAVLLSIFNDYLWWKEHIAPHLREEDRLFKTDRRARIVWLLEDGAAYTIMYPEDY